MPSPDFQSILLCPGCWSESLEWEPDAGATCGGCGAVHPFRKGMWLPVIPDASWRSVAQDTVALFMDFVENRDAALAEVGADMQAAHESFARPHIESRDDILSDVWRRLGLGREARILEVAAGDLRTASGLVRQGFNIVGVEPVPEFLSAGVFDRGIDMPRVCCSATRLPFAEGSFDACYCQAALHHLDDIAPVLREMTRVVRPGGIVAAIAEPYFAAGSSFARVRESIEDPSYEIGINERVPRFGDYRRSFAAAGLTNIVAYSRTVDIRPAHRLARLGIPVPFGGERHEITTGVIQRLRHALTHGEVSIWGMRGDCPPGRPPAVRPGDYPFAPEDYTLRRTRESLVGIWKRFLDPATVPSRVVVGCGDHEHLRRGFRRGGVASNGRKFRWLMSTGAVLLRVPGTGASRLRLLAAGPESARGPWWVSCSIDGRDVGSRELAAGADFSPLTWELPADAQGIVEVRFKANRLEARDGLAVSVMIAEIALE